MDLAAEDAPSCFCLSPLGNSEVLWTCSQCHSQSHLRCILQWVLRVCLNTSTPTFSCPMCRAQHYLSSLPGFEEDTGPAFVTPPPPSAGAPPPPVPDAAVMSLFSRMFTPVSRQSTARFNPTPMDVDEERPPRNHSRVSRETETAADEEDDDEDYEVEGTRPLIHIKTRQLSVSIRSLNLYYR